MAYRVTAYDDHFKAAFLKLAEELNASDTMLEAVSPMLKLGEGFQMVADLHLEDVPKIKHAGIAQQLNDAKQACVTLARLDFARAYGDHVAGLTLEPDVLRHQGLHTLASELEEKQMEVLRESDRFFLIGRLTQIDQIIRFYLGMNLDFERGREPYNTELFCLTALAESTEFDFNEVVKPEFENVISGRSAAR